jgi:hypothetical protein
MSRATFVTKIDGLSYKLMLDQDDPFPDPQGGYLRYYHRMENTTKLIHISELSQINGMAAGVLRRFGYDLDGQKCSFLMAKFFGLDVPTDICRTLGDEYRFLTETHEPCMGTIKRVLPRGSVDDSPEVWPTKP